MSGRNPKWRSIARHSQLPSCVNSEGRHNLCTGLGRQRLAAPQQRDDVACLLVGKLGTTRPSACQVQVSLDACMTVAVLSEAPSQGWRASSSRSIDIQAVWDTRTVTAQLLAVPHTCPVPRHAAAASPDPVPAVSPDPPEAEPGEHRDTLGCDAAITMAPLLPAAACNSTNAMRFMFFHHRLHCYPRPKNDRRSRRVRQPRGPQQAPGRGAT